MKISIGGGENMADIAGLYNGTLHTGGKNAFPAYADVGRRLAGTQGKLQ